MRLIDKNTRDFDQLRREYRWQIPENFNMANDLPLTATGKVRRVELRERERRRKGLTNS